MPQDTGPEQLRRDRTERRSIFLSYRRSDSQAWTGRLSDDLRQYYGSSVVYRDLDSNRGAQNYIEQINDALSRSRVVIAIIGPNWATAIGPDGVSRLDDSNDLVRLELEAALMSGIAIVPVIAGSAVPPSSGQLPQSLASVSRLQAQRLSDEDWPYDFGRLIETLERHGLKPMSSPDTAGDGPPKRPTKPRRFERTLQASRRRAYDATVGAVELLRYPMNSADPQAAQVQFIVVGRVVTASILDISAGRSKVVVEFGSVGSGSLAGATAAATVVALPLAPFVAAGAVALRVLERRFAVGFLDNVQSVLEGRGVGKDSAIFPGVEDWRNRDREV